MRFFQVVTAAMFVIVAATAMFDTRRGALIGATNDPGGIGSGFYPFWSAAVMGVAALLLIYRSLTSSRQEGAFMTREGLISLGKLVVPLIVAVASMAWLGFYLMVGVYMGYFARWIGGFRWRWVAAVATSTPVLVYLVFELSFRMLLPKSVLYYAYGFPI